MKTTETETDDYTITPCEDRLHGRAIEDVSLDPLDPDVTARIFEIASYGVLTGETDIQACRMEDGSVVEAETEEETEVWGVYALAHDNEGPSLGVFTFHVEDLTTEAGAKMLAEAVGLFIRKQVTYALLNAKADSSKT